MERILYKAEGTSEFRALLFLPSKAPVDLFMQEAQHGIDLYIQRVFIMKDCEELIPQYLRFVKGVVDSEDLSLNISRELLQQNRQIRVIRNGVVRKVLDTLGDLLKNDREKYEGFWAEFGRVIKEGIFQDAKNRERLMDLALFKTTTSDGKWATLADVVERMPEGQDAIYYMTGESTAAVENSPHLEAFRAKGYEVLLLTDPVDEIWVQTAMQYKEKPLRSVGKGEVELGSEEERKKADEARKEKAKEYKTLLEALEKRLDENVKEVRLSSRLTDSPACLVSGDFDMTPQLEQMMRAMGQDVPKTKRILELNPDHEVVEKLRGICETDGDDERIGQYADLLYGQALIAEGGKLPEGAGFTKRLTELMAKALG